MHFQECSRCDNFKHKYKMTSLEVDWMYFVQGGECANPGCSNEATVVDHCHTSGSVRQMLCNGCNTAYGQLAEDAQRMAGLLQYHAQHVQQEK